LALRWFSTAFFATSGAKVRIRGFALPFPVLAFLVLAAARDNPGAGTAERANRDRRLDGGQP